jgi:hypothetical protein
MRPRTYLPHAIGHAVSELSDRLVADRREKRITISEVSVRGVGDNPHHARHLAEHDRVRTTRPRERDASFNER